VVPPDSHRVSRVPWYLGTRRGRHIIFRVRDCYLLWLNFPEHSTRRVFCNSPIRMQPDHVAPRDPPHATPACLHVWSLGCSAFARRYLRNRGCFLFLQVLRWFTSLGWLPEAYVFSQGMTGHDPSRVSPFGHPRIKACLAAPRGLSQPATPFIASLRQGIHRLPLVA
jgi:hypothetical protein